MSENMDETIGASVGVCKKRQHVICTNTSSYTHTHSADFAGMFLDLCIVMRVKAIMHPNVFRVT